MVQRVRETASLQGVDPAIALAVVQIESAFRPQAMRAEHHLKTFSAGLFQILHATARAELGFHGTLQQLREPLTNIRLGVRYLARCLEGSEDLSWIACCYNAGFYATREACDRDPRVVAYSVKLQRAVQLWREEGADVE